MPLPSFTRVCSTINGFRVRFRRLQAEERKVTDSELSPWAYIGYIEGYSEFDLWTELGRWREDGSPHLFDLAIAASKIISADEKSDR